MEHPNAAKAQSVIRWYETCVRGFLEKQAAEALPSLDEERGRLSRVLDAPNETVVCLVGDSGIGKSTLLNAVVVGDRTIAPSGGVGPLTALATELRFSERPKLRVSYHKKAHLWRVAAALNFQVRRLRKGADSDALTPPTDLEESSQKEIEVEIAAALEPDSEGSAKGLEEFIRMSKLMIAGSQNETRTLEYLADALSTACGVAPRWGSTFSDEDEKRIESLTKALQVAADEKELVIEQGADARQFRETLRAHAAGFLAPLIKRIEVGWPSEVLRSGLVLVDLPGVGVAGDVYKLETQRFVREKARAVVLVVGKSGPTEPVMDLLRTTGFWDRLLLSSDDPSADPCALMLAISRVDDIANEQWFELDPDEEGRRPKSKAQVFVEQAAALSKQMRAQFEQQLEGFVKTHGSEAIKTGRESARKALLDSFKLFPVSAIEYRRLLADNHDDRPFVASIGDTGVPAISEELVRLARSQTETRERRLADVTRRFADLIALQIDSIESTWRSDRASEEADRVRAALQVILGEKSKDLEDRRASFRTFLNQTVPAQIKAAVLEAREEARKSVNAYLRTLRDAHWATLRAAVQRGGTYLGARHINLPVDIALRFQDPVAAVWSQSLLKSIRGETYELASAMRHMVVEICDWAEKEEGAFVDKKVIDTQKRAVSAHAERLRDVGREAIDDLRNVVKTEVVETIEAPIRSVCRDFVEKNKHVGAGVKQRILELFEELAEDATTAAGKPTEKTLLEHYKGVNADIKKAFVEWGEPLEAVADAIVSRHEDRLKRSDSQRRGKVLEQVAEVRAEAPDGLLISDSR